MLVQLGKLMPDRDPRLAFSHMKEPLKGVISSLAKIVEK